MHVRARRRVCLRTLVTLGVVGLPAGGWGCSAGDPSPASQADSGGQGAGGSGATDGTSASGGSSRTGGDASSGAVAAAGGTSRGGGNSSGGSRGVAGNGAGGATTTNPGDCATTVTSGSTSPQMAKVGVVEWSTTMKNPSEAQVVYTVANASASVPNQGGTAPVDPLQPNHRTLLLGLKPSSTYDVRVEATAADGSTCTSDAATLTTGALSGAPAVTRKATKPSAQAVGFVITSGGVNKTGGSGINQA